MTDTRFNTIGLWAMLLALAGMTWSAASALGLQDDPQPVDDESSAAYTLSVEGACPGLITIRWSGAGAGERQGLIIGNAEGSTRIPAGQPCSGVVLGIQGDLRLLKPPGFFSTGNGSGLISGTLDEALCGRYVQLLRAAACVTSNVAQIPISDPE